MGTQICDEPYSLTVAKDGSGTGTVVSDPAGIDCGTNCAEDFAADRAVTLTGNPDADSALDGWSGADCPGNGDCKITMNQDVAITATFNPDGDSDGISDDVENGGPNGGDGNNDGTPDSQQANVTTFQGTSDGWATLVSPAGTTLADVTTTSIPSTNDLPSGHQCPCSSLGFEVHGVESGGAAKVTLILHTANASINSYLKYGPTPDNNEDHWYEFPAADNGPGATITTEDGRTTIVLSFVDGQKGDADLSGNGVIVDPGASSIKNRDGGGGGGGCFLGAVCE